MRVRLPDGTIIDGVPEGTTKEELTALLAKKRSTEARQKILDDMSALERFGVGVGRSVDQTYGGVADFLGFDEAAKRSRDRTRYSDDVESGYLTAGEVVGDIAQTLPGGAVGAVGKGLPMATRALRALAGEAAATGLVETAQTGDPAQGAAAAALTATTGYALPRMLGTLPSDAATRLKEMGVKLTPGQLYGGIVGALEDMMSYLPGTSGGVRNLREKAMQSWNTALREGSPPYKAMELAKQSFSDMYDQIFAGDMRLNDGVFYALRAAQREAAQSLPDDIAENVVNTLDKYIPQLSGDVSGSKIQAIYRSIGDQANKAARDGDGELASILGSVRQSIRQSLPDQKPLFLDAIDAEYAKHKVLERATAYPASAARQPAGTVTPGQVLQASAVGRRSASSQGKAPLQQEAVDAAEVMGARYPGGAIQNAITNLSVPALAGATVASGSIVPLAGAYTARGLGVHELGRRVLTSDATRDAARKLTSQSPYQIADRDEEDYWKRLFEDALYAN